MPGASFIPCCRGLSYPGACLGFPIWAVRVTMVLTQGPIHAEWLGLCPVPFLNPEAPGGMGEGTCSTHPGCNLGHYPSCSKQGSGPGCGRYSQARASGLSALYWAPTVPPSALARVPRSRLQVTLSGPCMVWSHNLHRPCHKCLPPPQPPQPLWVILPAPYALSGAPLLRHLCWGLLAPPTGVSEPGLPLVPCLSASA